MLYAKSLSGLCRLSIVFGFLLSAGAGFSSYAEESKQRHHLPKPTGPRFEVVDRVWPENAGEGDVCLWKNDALCSVSFTIDDNCAPDHSWWVEQGEKYGFKFTWFIITERVGTGDHWGTWEGFSALQGMGHEVQSHSVTHLSGLEDGAGHDERVKTVDDEYRLSKEDIEKNISGSACRVFAYPNGPKPPNERRLAERYFIGARGVSGHINQANQIDYLETHSLGNGINVSTEKAPWSQFRTMLDRSFYRGRNYRGWSCTHFHQVKEDKRAGVVEQFEFLKEHGSDVWVGLFGDVVRYGQERDTAELISLEGSVSVFRFSLTDDMEDALFSYPLTLKVRLPDSWETVRAVQNKKKIAARLIEHEGHFYALVQAVPDRGVVMVGR